MYVTIGSFPFFTLIPINAQAITYICVTCTLALELPEHWEPMHQEVFKKVELQPNSSEYQDVARGFHKTAKNNIRKVSMPTQKHISLQNTMSN